MRRLTLESVTRRRWLAALPAVAATLLAVCGAAAETSPTNPCFVDRNARLACPVDTGLKWVRAVDHSTGLGHPTGYFDVDVISLRRPCRSVRLAYVSGFQGRFARLPWVTLPLGQAAVTAGGPPVVRSPKWVVAHIRAQLRAFAVKPARFELPRPTSRWYVYGVHGTAEALARGGVQCNRL